ncbi:MAG: oligosaccharide flippase family protein [Pseudomonadota bacterium]
MSKNLTTWQKLSRNTLSNFAGAFVPMAVGFFLMPFVIRHIGTAAFGIWMLASGVIGYMGLISLGLGPTVTKKSAEYLALRDEDGLNRMLSTVFVLYLVLGVTLGAVILAMAPVMPGLFHVDAGQGTQLKWVFWLIGLQAALGFPFAIFGGLIHGLHDFHVSNGIVVVNSLFRLAGSVLLLNSGMGLISLLVLELFLSASSWTLQMIWVRKRIPGLRIRLSFYDSTRVYSLIGFSGAMFLWQIAGVTVHRVSRIIIGLFMPVSNITVYEVANRIVEYSRMMFTSFLKPLLPVSSELQALATSKALKAIYLRGTKIVFAVYLVVSAALFLWGEPFIHLWMGQDFLSASLLLHILLVGNLYQAQNVVAHVMLPGMGLLKTFTRAMAAYPVVTIALMLVLINVYGLVGVAMAATAAFIVIETYFLRQILSIFQVSFVELLRNCHLPSMMALLPAMVFALVSRRFVATDTWIGLTLAVAVFVLVYSLAFWQWGLSRSEKESLRGLWRSMQKRRKSRDETGPDP